MSAPTLDKPLVVELQTTNRVNSYKTKVLVEFDTAATLCNLELVLYPEGGIQKFDLSTDVKAIDYTLKILLKMLGSENPRNSVTLQANEGAKFHIKYDKPTPYSYNVILQTPSRTVHTEAKYSLTEIGLTVYPNRHESERKYEVAVKSTTDYWNQQNKYEGHISHPSLTKDMTVTVQVEDSGERRSGAFEIDVFPDTQDKVSGALQSIWLANNTIKIEATLQSRVRIVHIYILEMHVINHHIKMNYRKKHIMSIIPH